MTRGFKLFRYRRPSIKTLLGVTAAKKRINKELGITALLKPFRWWGNQQRTIKRKLGYYSPAARILRQGLPSPMGGGRTKSNGGLGCLVIWIVVLAATVGAPIVVVGHFTGTRSFHRGDAETRRRDGRTMEHDEQAEATERAEKRWLKESGER